MTQEPKSIEAYKLLDLIDLVSIAKNALNLLDDFQTDIKESTPETSDFEELKQRLDDMLNEKYVRRFIELDDDFDIDTIDTILENSQAWLPTKGRDEVLASRNGKGIIKVTGELAEHVRQVETAEIKLDELLGALTDSEFENENFWAYRSINNELNEIRKRLTPLLGNTRRVKS